MDSGWLTCPFCGKELSDDEVRGNTYNLRMNGSYTTLSWELSHHCPRSNDKGVYRHYTNIKMSTLEELKMQWNKRYVKP